MSDRIFGALVWLVLGLGFFFASYVFSYYVGIFSIAALGSMLLTAGAFMCGFEELTRDE